MLWKFRLKQEITQCGLHVQGLLYALCYQNVTSNVRNGIIPLFNVLHE